MTATTASRASACADDHGAAHSNTRGRRVYRPTPAHTSAVSLLRFLPEISEPRIFRRGGLGLAGDDDDGVVGPDLVTGDVDPRLVRLLGDGGECRPPRLARLACGRGPELRSD